MELFKFIKESCSSAKNTPSSSRIQGYLLLIPVLLFSLSIVGIEISEYVSCAKQNKEYSMDSQTLIAFGMVLSHHLSLVFSRSKANGANADNASTPSSTSNSDDTQTT